MKTATITEFRRNLFRLVDEALATGEPIEIRRKGGRVVLRREPLEDVETRHERFERFMARPKPPGWAHVDIQPRSAAAESDQPWAWDEEPELDR